MLLEREDRMEGGVERRTGVEEGRRRWGWERGGRRGTATKHAGRVRRPQGVANATGIGQHVIFPTGPRLAKSQTGMHHDQAAASNCAKGKAPASEGVLSVGDNALKNGGETEGCALLAKGWRRGMRSERPAALSVLVRGWSNSRGGEREWCSSLVGGGGTLSVVQMMMMMMVR